MKNHRVTNNKNERLSKFCPIVGYHFCYLFHLDHMSWIYVPKISNRFLAFLSFYLFKQPNLIHLIFVQLPFKIKLPYILAIINNLCLIFFPSQFLIDIFKKKDKLYWSDETIAFNGIPFLILNQKHLIANTGKTATPIKKNKPAESNDKKLVIYWQLF